METNIPDSIDTRPITIIEENGFYLYQGRNGLIQISNFKMRVIFFIQSNTYPIRVVEIINEHGLGIQFNMPADAMRNADTFCKTIEGKGNFIFTGSKPSLFALKEFLFKYEKNAIELPYLGYQNKYNFYAFSNGIFENDGIFHTPDNNGIVNLGDKDFYLPLSNKNLSIEDETEYQTQKLFIHQPGESSFEEWASAFIEVYGVKGIIGLCYLLAAIYRDIIFDKLHCMPHLFLSGKPQSGKSTFRRGLMRFFGEEQKPIQCGMGSTQKAFSRKLGQFANALVSGEEYKNDIDQRIVETLKGIYDGEGYERAKKTNDNQTHTTAVLSSLILTGQQLPTRENALFSRVNLVEFSKCEFNQKEVEKFETLKSIQEKGLTHLTGQLFKHHDLVKSLFNSTFAEIDKRLRKSFSNKTIADRIINNYASIITPYLILKNNYIFDFTFIKYDIMEEIENILSEQLEHLNATTEINQFWEVIKLLIDNRDVMRENVHYVFKKIDGKECLCIRFEAVADLYREYCIKRRLPNFLDTRSLSAYLKQDKAFIRGKYNSGCHYIKVGGQNRSFFSFDLDLITVNMREVRQN